MAVRVCILMGSRSDLDCMRHASDVLRQFDVSFVIRVLSAHRTPDAVAEFIRSFEEEGGSVIIAAAGGAAHLAGVVASHTCLPVIGVPMQGGALGGLDSLLSTVQMPTGIPVATTAIGNAGASNAALLALQILSVSDESLKENLKAYRRKMTENVLSNSVVEL